MLSLWVVTERALLMVCSRCRCHHYCSRECQVAAWDEHKCECDLFVRVHNQQSKWSRTPSLTLSSGLMYVWSHVRHSKRRVKMIKKIQPRRFKLYSQPWRKELTRMLTRKIWGFGENKGRIGIAKWGYIYHCTMHGTGYIRCIVVHTYRLITKMTNWDLLDS